MLNNVGKSDRILRLILASVSAYLGLFTYEGTAFGIGLTIASGLLTISGLFGFCFLYTVLGINTNPQGNQR